MKTKILTIALFTSLTILTACNNETKNDDKPPKELFMGQIRYERIKTNYELFGTWTINNSFYKSSCDYEIYRKGDEYIGIVKFRGQKYETLKKDGKNYFVEGSRFGRYYKIDSDKKMTLFDKDGELTEAGLIAKKK